MAHIRARASLALLWVLIWITLSKESNAFLSNNNSPLSALGISSDTRGLHPKCGIKHRANVNVNVKDNKDNFENENIILNETTKMPVVPSPAYTGRRRFLVAAGSLLPVVASSFSFSFSFPFPFVVKSTWSCRAASLPGQSTGNGKGGTSTDRGASTFKLLEIQSLVFDRLLGQGTFKRVYQVHATSYRNETPPPDHCFALAVRQIRTKSDLKDAVREIRIVESLQKQLHAVATFDRDGGDSGGVPDCELFEHVFAWWIQSTPTEPFVPGQPVFDPSSLSFRQSVRGNFLGSKWIVAVKPLYEMDLRRFMQQAPLIKTTMGKHNQLQQLQQSAGISLNDTGALALARSMVRAGRILHQNGLVHRDIKPKNVMICNGHAVLIDFGFAGAANPCLVEPGKIKGEAQYVLAQDVARYQGCQRGDCYAMGKTLFEVLFEPEPDITAAMSTRETITTQGALGCNLRFREKLAAAVAQTDNREDNSRVSRFALSATIHNVLVEAIQGLCHADNPLSFQEAEAFLLSRLQSGTFGGFTS